MYFNDVKYEKIVQNMIQYVPKLRSSYSTLLCQTRQSLIFLTLKYAIKAFTISHYI